MSSLEDGFGGGVDDMVSANTGGLRFLFWEVAGYHGFAGSPVALVALAKFCSRCHSGQFANGTKRTVPEAGILELHDGHHILPSRSHHVLHDSPTSAIWWGTTREAENPSRTPCPRTD
jgi:hypothetical protein